MSLTVATWNVNSLRARLECVNRFLREQAPDVVCLQEIKVTNDKFPTEVFLDNGYDHMAIHGQKAYHGVAICARVPLADAGTKDWCRSGEARHVYATLPGGIQLHNFYIPAGGDLADADENPKFAFKLRMLRALARWYRARRAAANRWMLVGDLNIAPLETDVWSHKQLLRVVSHTPVEVRHLARLQRSHDWVDAVRRFVPPDERLYSWWSYRAPDWDAADKGRRLDHIWVTPALAPELRYASVLRDVRGWDNASDHVPVLAGLEG